MGNIINNLNENELELLKRICIDFVNNCGVLSDDVISEIQFIENVDLLEKIKDMENLKNTVLEMVENGILELVDENGEEFTLEEIQEYLDGFPSDDIECDCEDCETETDIEKMLEVEATTMALNIEKERQERLMDFDILGEEVNSNLSKEALELSNAYILMVKNLIKNGISEGDSLAIANSFVANKLDKSIREIDTINNRNNMI